MHTDLQMPKKTTVRPELACLRPAPAWEVTPPPARRRLLPEGPDAVGRWGPVPGAEDNARQVRATAAEPPRKTC